jgi:CelD/BcsL family acetyltransferase involved in cellulose biosynthesis
MSEGWQLVSTQAGLARIEAQWDSTELESRGSTPFQSFAWCNHWLAKRASAYSPYVLLDTDNGVIAPFALKVTGALRTLCLIGTGDSDYLGLITKPELRQAWRAVIDELLARRRDWDVLHLHSVREKELIVSVLREHRGLSLIERTYDVCPLLRVSETWDAFLKSRKKLRYETRRWAKRMEETGRLIVQSFATPLSADVFREMVDVERDSWKWESGMSALKSGEQAEFLASVLQDPGMPARVWCLQVNDEMAAFAVVMEGSTGWYYYLPSFRNGFPNAGAYLLSCIVKEAFGNELEFVDLLQGGHGYKTMWSTDTIDVGEVVAGRSVLGKLTTGIYGARWWAAKSQSMTRLRNAVTKVGDRRPNSH